MPEDNNTSKLLTIQVKALLGISSPLWIQSIS